MKVFLVCGTNSVCGPIAEAYLGTLDKRLNVISAGTKPTAAIHPFAIRVMHEKGYSLLGHQTKKVDHFFGEHFDYFVTLSHSARTDCLTFPGCVTHRVHFGLEEPNYLPQNLDTQLFLFRKVRDRLFEVMDTLYSTELEPRLALNDYMGSPLLTSILPSQANRPVMGE